MKDTVLAELRQAFRPEFLNRLDEIIVFHALSEEHLKQIVEIQLGGFAGAFGGAAHYSWSSRMRPGPVWCGVDTIPTTEPAFEARDPAGD